MASHSEVKLVIQRSTTLGITFDTYIFLQIEHENSLHTQDPSIILEEHW
jgi:hypothetical protein